MGRQMLGKLSCGLTFLFAFVFTAITILPTAISGKITAYAGETPVYTLNATLMEGTPGVYLVEAEVGATNTGDNPATIGIPSVSKQKLSDMPTTETPAIVTGAAVNYETKTGPTEFTPIEGAELIAPYSYFRWNVIMEERKDADGNPLAPHKKLSGFDGSYYIIRIDVSQIIEGKTGYLHVKQEGNKALMAAIGMEGTTYADGLGNKNGSYSLADGAIAMKDTTGNYREQPYFDVIVLSSSKLVAGADQGAQDAPSADIKLSFYVDEQDDYNPALQPLNPAAMPTFPWTCPDDGKTYQTEQDYTKALLAKFFNDESATPENNASSYLVKGSDLEIDVVVDDTEVTGETPEYWSLTKAMDYQTYDSHIIKLICEVPVLEGLRIQGDEGNQRNVVLDVNSFDIQIANTTEQNVAGLTISRNAQLEIQDGTNTSGAELAIGNNATMVIESGGILVIDESCTNEVEYDAATTTGEGTAPDLTNGEITIKDGGKLINNGVVNIEGMEAKPLDPNQQEQQQGEQTATDMRPAMMLVEAGGQFDNNGCFSIKGNLYNMGTVNNYGKYNDTIVANDPDKGQTAYHRGIQVTWKDDVRVEGVIPGALNIGIDAEGKTNSGAVLNNYGDIVVTPGTINLQGTLNNLKIDAGDYTGHVYLCNVNEAVVPITPTQQDPTKVEERVSIPERKSTLNSKEGSVYNTNEGYFGGATVHVISNGILGDLTPLSEKWQQDEKGQWYYCSKDTGEFAKGWVQAEDKWYYMDNNTRIMKTGWVSDNGKWYYMGSSGAMKTGWVSDGGKWYYMNSSGAMMTGWVSDGGQWYFMNSSGAMMKGWLKRGNSWYYLGSSGAMVTGWLKIDGSWYFFKSSGVMAANEWCGGYWLNANGTWTYKPVGSWGKNNQGWWFGDTSGWFAKNQNVKIDDVIYVFNAAGYWVSR